MDPAENEQCICGSTEHSYILEYHENAYGGQQHYIETEQICPVKAKRDRDTALGSAFLLGGIFAVSLVLVKIFA